jgi:hypothetical protein
MEDIPGLTWLQDAQSLVILGWSHGARRKENVASIWTTRRPTLFATDNVGWKAGLVNDEAQQAMLERLEPDPPLRPVLRAPVAYERCLLSWKSLGRVVGVGPRLNS